MAGKAVPMGKSRKVSSEPWLTIEANGWTWKVLKAYTDDPSKPHARWFCDVSSPYTFGGSDMGDTYVEDIDGVITQRDPSVPDSAIPARLRGTLFAGNGITVRDARSLEKGF